MNGIKNPPNNYNFGLDFNYALWTEGTDVTMVNVPWNNDYRDVVGFANKAALNTYINGIESSGTRISNMSYVKPNQPIRLDIPFNKANTYNYLRASNPLQPIPGSTTKDFYYFITDVKYIAPNTTEVIVQLDLWATYKFDMSFGSAYIERGHIGIANTKNFDNYGRDYLTIPEGIDLGSEYQIVAKRREILMSPDGTKGVGINDSAVLVASTVNLTAEAGDANAPILVAASGSYFSTIASGASYYLWYGSNTFAAFMASIANKPWVGQGIISITVIPDIKRYNSSFNYNASASQPTVAPANSQKSLLYSLFSQWRNSSEILNNIPLRYRHLKKFLTSPYMFIEMTTWTGAPILIKPEAWLNENATIMERAALIPPNQRVSFHPYKYNAVSGSVTDDKTSPEATAASNIGGDDNGEYLDVGVSISNFPTLALVNNGAIGYMASNNSGIAFARNAADWAQQRALRGNEVTYDQTSSAINTSRAIAGIGVTADAAQTSLGNVTALQQGAIGAAGSIVGSGLSANPSRIGGAVVGAAGTAASLAVQTSANTQALNIRTISGLSTNRAGAEQSGFVRDTNKDLADWAAKGDYENTIAGVNAKVQDAQLIQPSVVGQFGGESMNFLNNTAELSVRWKMLDQASIQVIGDYWLRYGYAVRRWATVLPTTMQVMSKFTYWKLKETYIVNATMPETFKQAIRGIFEKGVTVWSAPEYIGQTDIGDNVPLGGITL